MYLNVDDNLLGFINLEEKIKEINEYITIKIIDDGFVFGRYDEVNPSYQLINFRSKKLILELEEIKDIFVEKISNVEKIINNYEQSVLF